MYMSGAVIGMEIIAVENRQIRKDLPPALIVSIVVVVGVILLNIAVYLIEAVSLRTIKTIFSVFALSLSHKGIHYGFELKNTIEYFSCRDVISWRLYKS